MAPSPTEGDPDEPLTGGGRHGLADVWEHAATGSGDRPEAAGEPLGFDRGYLSPGVIGGVTDTGDPSASGDPQGLVKNESFKEVAIDFKSTSGMDKRA